MCCYENKSVQIWRETICDSVLIILFLPKKQLFNFCFKLAAVLAKPFSDFQY